MLSQGRKLNVIATDDAHFRTNDFFGGWVEVKSKSNEPDHLLKSLKEGNYYSSQGPKIIDLSITRDKLEVETSPVASVILVGYGSASIAKHGNEMKKTVINFPKGAKSPWVRAIVIDQNGKKAWTNPIWTEEF